MLSWNNGDQAALNNLMSLVYHELRRLARRSMRSEDPTHTLEPTALVHDAYLRLIDQNRITWQNRAQFFGVASQIIRRRRYVAGLDAIEDWDRKQLAELNLEPQYMSPVSSPSQHLKWDTVSEAS